MGKMRGAEQLLYSLWQMIQGKPQQINYSAMEWRDGIQVQILVLQRAGAQRCPSSDHLFSPPVWVEEGNCLGDTVLRFFFPKLWERTEGKKFSYILAIKADIEMLSRCSSKKKSCITSCDSCSKNSESTKALNLWQGWKDQASEWGPTSRVCVQGTCALTYRALGHRASLRLTVRANKPLASLTTLEYFFKDLNAMECNHQARLKMPNLSTEEMSLTSAITWLQILKPTSSHKHSIKLAYLSWKHESNGWYPLCCITEWAFCLPTVSLGDGLWCASHSALMPAPQ